MTVGRLVSMDPCTIPPSRPPALLLTLDVLGVVNDKVAIPHNRQVHRQITDIIPLIGVLLEAGTVVMLRVVGHHPHATWRVNGAYGRPSTSLKTDY